MHYTFPKIETIDDVLPAIEGRDEFSVTDKGEYTCINYHLVKEDTFPEVLVNREVIAGITIYDYENKVAAIRRECRGILFDNKTRKIIRRPLHKFFNINENGEHHQDNINLDMSHRILEKLDGSMCAPFILNEVLRYGSKAGITDVSLKFEEFISNSEIDYDNFFCTMYYWDKQYTNIRILCQESKNYY